MEYAVAFMAGVSYLILGLSLLLRWQDWSDLLKALRHKGRTSSLSMGGLHLAIGTFIVAFHWEWAGLPLLLTLLGVKAIGEGFIYTLFPEAMIAMLKWFEPYHRGLLRPSGLVTIIIALLISCEWVQHLSIAAPLN
jgi:uncharacterized protein YjeT (DUF2065 family)